ncbi:MAG: hypothetical protein ACI8RZ_002243 [Myxococcota bacterium]
MIGRQAGTAAAPRTVVVSAHYDHLDDFIALIADENAATATAAFVDSAPSSLPVILVELTTEMTTSNALADL